MHHEGSSSGLGRAWGGAFFTISWHLRKPPLQGLERRLHGVPVRCSVLYNVHHEGSSPGPGSLAARPWKLSSPGPGRAWRVGFMVFLLYNTICTMKAHPQVFLLGALCYTIMCTMKALPQGLEGVEEEPSWHLRKPPPGPGEEASWCSCSVLCAIQYAP